MNFFFVSLSSFLGTKRDYQFIWQLFCTVLYSNWLVCEWSNTKLSLTTRKRMEEKNSWMQTVTRCSLLELWRIYTYKGSSRGSLSCLPPKRKVFPILVQFLECAQAWFQHFWSHVHTKFLPLLYFYCCPHLQKRGSFLHLLVLGIHRWTRVCR